MLTVKSLNCWIFKFKYKKCCFYLVAPSKTLQNKNTLFHLIFFKRCYSIISFYIYCVDCPIFPTKKEACGPIPKPKLSHQSESWGHGSMLQDPQEHRRSVGALQYPQESTLAEEARVTTPRLLGHELPTSYRLRRR